MYYSETDIIVAPATSLDKTAPLAILRLSGENCLSLLNKAFKPHKKKPLQSWRMHYGIWHDDKGMVDDCMVSVYRAPHSYTGQDMAEIFCHGNPILLEAIEQSLIKQGARRAKPGEFTMRAVLNGKKSLLEAEGLEALFGAHTRYQADLIRRQAQGPLVSLIKDKIEAILQIQAHIEATIDYGEEDIDALESASLIEKTNQLITAFGTLRDSASFLKGMKRGFKVLITGEPNVGKSTLFNALVKHERAIVTDIPGTTRDLITETIEIKGLPVVLIDSAGVRETDDKIETMGIEKIFTLLNDVDLVLFLTSSHKIEPPYEALTLLPKERWINVVTKADLNPQLQTDHLLLSALNNRGITALENEIVLRLAADFDQQSAYLINQRQEEIVTDVLDLLKRAVIDYQNGFGEEVLSSYLNSTRALLGELTGETTVEDILDRMFSNFCLGK